MSDYLYNITPREFRILARNERMGNVTYYLEPLERPNKCPRCRRDDIILHGVNRRKARDLNEFEKKVGIIIKGHRYLCKTCGKTWVDTYKSIDIAAKMTNRMREYIINKALKTKLIEISEELDISITSIEKIILQYVDRLEKNRRVEAPQVLGLDETRLNGVFRGIFVDVQNRQIIDMTPNRKYETVHEWLINLPQKERIQCVTIDMYGPFRDALMQAMPNVLIVIDRFHVIKLLNEALDHIRMRHINDLTEDDKKRMKGTRWLLLRNWNELSENDQCKLKELFSIFPIIHRAHSYKEEFRNIYFSETREEAESAFDMWKERSTDILEYQAFASVIEKWRREVFNYFENAKTNAVTECLNNICKKISSEGRGYSFKLLRAKLIYRDVMSLPEKYVYIEMNEDFVN